LNFRLEDRSQMQKKIIAKTLKDEKGKFLDRINKIYWTVLFFSSLCRLESLDLEALER
jgi:hypothetical protein